MLEIVNYSKRYENGKLAVNNLSLKVEPKDIFAFIGHNGAGKTTTIKSVVGILPLTEGEIYINGLSVKDNPLECKKINGEIRLLEHEDYKWFSKKELENFQFAPADVFIVERIRE